MTPNVNEALRAIHAADAGKPRKSILVLGGGMAGLAAAHELDALKHQVELFEGSPRLGGRVWTHRFPSGQYHELGAMRIPASHDYTRYYAKLCGLTLRKFVTAHQNPLGFYDIRGVQTRIADAARTLLPLFSIAPSERHLAATAVAPAIFGQLMAQAIETLTDEDEESLFGDENRTERARTLDSTSLADFLERGVKGRETKALIGLTTGLEVWWDKAITMFLRDEIRGGDGLEEIVGGMDLLPQKLAGRLGGVRVNLETEVVRIERRDRRLVIRFRPAKGPEFERETELAICTLPFSTLRRVELVGLSTAKLEAIRNLTYASATKVLIHCADRFWESRYGIYGGASISDQISRSTYYPSDNVAGPPIVSERRGRRGLHTTFEKAAPGPTHAEISHGPGVLVGSYCWGQDARRLGALPKAERARAVIDSVARFHPEIRAAANDDASMSWSDYKWSSGAFSFLRHGDHQRYFGAAVAPEGPLYFAGEHCSTDQAWIQGALISSLRAVGELCAK